MAILFGGDMELFCGFTFCVFCFLFVITVKRQQLYGLLSYLHSPGGIAILAKV